MDARKKMFIWVGAVLILATGAIHVVDAKDSFEEAAYKGWLFYLNGLGALVAAYGILLKKRLWGWTLGLLVAVGSVVLYIASRTVGLPGIPAEPDAWFEPLGVTSLIAEALFAALFLLQRRKTT